MLFWWFLFLKEEDLLECGQECACEFNISLVKERGNVHSCVNISGSLKLVLAYGDHSCEGKWVREKKKKKKKAMKNSSFHLLQHISRASAASIP